MAELPGAARTGAPLNNMTDYLLEVLDGDRSGETVSLRDGPLRIGRRPGNDLILGDEKVSGQHAEIVAEGDGFVLRDLDSRNGTFLDDRQVSEVALSPGDVFVVGRTSIRFGAPGAAPAGAGDPDLQIKRLDRAAGRKRSSSSLILIVLLVVVGGVGAWWKWGGGEAGRAQRASRAEALSLRGNLLPELAAQLETGEGWQLDWAGDGFEPSGRAHSGTGSVMARYPTGEGSEPTGYAIARSEDVTVVTSGDRFEVRAFIRTSGSARGAVRAHFFADDESETLSVRVGAPMGEHSGFAEQIFAADVPSGCTRMAIELVAVLPDSSAQVWFDDVAVTSGGGGGAAINLVAPSGQRFVGCAGGGALRSSSTEQPYVVHSVQPLLSGALEPLARARTVAVTDVGANLAVHAAEGAFDVSADGAAGLVFELPAGAASSPLVEQDGLFAPPEDAAGFEARRLLLGNGPTRLMIELPSAAPIKVAADGSRLTLDGVVQCRLWVGFESEGAAARGLLQEARRADRDGDKAMALGKLDELRGRFPHDSAALAEALTARAEILDGLRRMLDRLESEYQDAAFFRTRGGFDRVLAETAQIRTAYGSENPPEKARIDSLAERAAVALESFETARTALQVTRLEALQKVFEGEGQTGLAGLVKDYLGRHRAGGR